MHLDYGGTWLISWSTVPRQELLINGKTTCSFPLSASEGSGPLTFTEKLHILKVSQLHPSDVSICVFFIGYTNVFLCEQGLLKFVFPLGLVYFAEYFINQGLVSSGASHPSPCCSASLFLVLDCQL